MKFGTLVRLKSVDECAEAFNKVKAMGLESCQLVYKPACYTIEDARLIKDAAEAYGVEISAFFAGFRDNYTAWDLKYDFRNAGLNSVAFGAARLQYLLGVLPFLQELDVSDMIIHAGFVPNDPFAPEYAEMLCRVKLLAERAKKYGINILFETGGESPITLLRLIMELNTGNLFVNLDTGNLIMYGYGNPRDAVYTLGKYVRNVHAKDGLPPTEPYKIGQEVPIGEGFVDFERVFAALNAIGYDRFVTIEREIDGAKQTEDIEKGIQYVKEILENLKGKGE